MQLSSVFRNIWQNTFDYNSAKLKQIHGKKLSEYTVKHLHQLMLFDSFCSQFQFFFLYCHWPLSFFIKVFGIICWRTPDWLRSLICFCLRTPVMSWSKKLICDNISKTIGLPKDNHIWQWHEIIHLDVKDIKEKE